MRMAAGTAESPVPAGPDRTTRALGTAAEEVVAVVHIPVPRHSRCSASPAEHVALWPVRVHCLSKAGTAADRALASRTDSAAVAEAVADADAADVAHTARPKDNSLLPPWEAPAVQARAGCSPVQAVAAVLRLHQCWRQRKKRKVGSADTTGYNPARLPAAEAEA